MSDDFTLDFSDVKAASGFDPIPRGWYLMSVNDAGETETKNAGKLPVGTPGVNVEFEVVEPEEYSNRKVWNNFWFAQKSLPFVKAFLVAAGVEEDQLDGRLGVDDLFELFDSVVGNTLLVRLKVQGERTVGGKTYEPRNETQAYERDTPENRERRFKSNSREAKSSLLP